MTDHKYVFQGPVGQMQLSHCQVWVQGMVDKLSLEDCEVQVNGIVNHRYNISREKVVVVDPPKPASDEELRRLRRRIEELENKLSISQIEVRQLRAKVKEPSKSDIDKHQQTKIKKLENEIIRTRNENLDTIGALRDKVEDLQRVNRDLASKLGTARREIESGKAVAFDRQMDAFATIMAAFPFTPISKLEKEFEVDRKHIVHDAELCGVEKSTELRAEAKDYLARQGLKLDDDRGGDQGNHFMKPVEKVARNGRVVATYKSVSEAAEMNNLSPNAINDHCRGNVKGYSKAGYKYRYKKQ
jgi:polyhydroxyalkanoate synthesis regulator phasin